jgi:hypothetical protein
VRIVHDEVLASTPRRAACAWPAVAICATTASYCRPASTSCGTRFPASTTPTPRPASCTPGRPAADRGAAQAARSDAGRRRLRDVDSQGALPLPAGPVRARLPGCRLLQANKPKSKVVVLDANEDIVSKKGLFAKAWADSTRDHRVSAAERTARRRRGDQTARPRIRQGQGRCAERDTAAPCRRHRRQSGLKLINKRWVDIDWLSMESTARRGARPRRRDLPGADDAEVGRHGQPACEARRRGDPQPAVRRATERTPLVMNTCYSFVDNATRSTSLRFIPVRRRLQACSRCPAPVASRACAAKSKASTLPAGRRTSGPTC